MLQMVGPREINKFFFRKSIRCHTINYANEMDRMWIIENDSRIELSVLYSQKYIDTFFSLSTYFVHLDTMIRISEQYNGNKEGEVR